MSNPNDPKITAVIEQVCVRFETDWRAGRRPTIETCLGEVPPVEQGTLFRELLELEVECRLRSGERPPVEEYQKRFPSHSDIVSAVFFKPAPTVPPRQTDIDPGAIQLTLAVIDGPDKGQVFTFAGHDVFLAGRSKQTALRLKDPYCGRYQFMIEVNPPLCRLTDMGSRNSTSVNDQNIKSKSVDLREGDVIRAGHTALRVAISRSEPAEQSGISEALTMYPPNTADAQDPESTQPTLPALPIAGQVRPTVSNPGQPKPSAAVQPGGASKGAVGVDLPGYEFLSEKGQGGMGKVYRARRLADGAIVAIKAISTDAAANHKQLQRFMREAIILCQLRHPHIVAFNELLQARDRPFIVMEFVEGNDVASVLKQQGPVPVRTAVRMLSQALSALEYAHARGFVHRDIKPHNMLIAEREGGKTVKLADFGLARVYQESRLSGLTLNGEWGGSLAYIAPEQITQFRQVTPAADQYSAAATLYSMLCNQFIFDFEAKSNNIVAKILQDQPIPLLARNPQVPRDLAEIIHRALAKDPDGRFPSVKAFRRALQPFAQ